jgi:nicotinate-nucleotide--dimethylbenzimidazole phosphoribosyltransferase
MDQSVGVLGSDLIVPVSILEAIRAVEPPDASWSDRVSARHDRLTMPQGSLGRLLELGRLLGAVQRTDRPIGHPALVAVFAADHGVSSAGVSAYPREVTAQMVANYLAGGAAVNVLARRAGADVRVVDMGVVEPVTRPTSSHMLESHPVRRGTSSFLDGPAMTRAEAFQAFATGLELGEHWVDREGYRIVALGEMGIGNTTTASALAAALTDTPVDALVGRGTGIDDDRLELKRALVASAVARHCGACSDLWDVVARLGGFEIIGLAGLAIAAARGRAVVVLDGFISSVSGLIAARLCPSAVGSMIAAHVGTEPGHRVVLDALGLSPLLDLGLRLGEGTGAALALPLLAAAADLLRDMATFDSASVSGPVGAPEP